jgi:WD40 repeat protein
VTTGERSSGNYTAPVSTARPLQPILDEYARLTERSMGTIALSPDEELVAASSLPGELVIYRLVTSYETLLGYVTATAYAQIEAANLVAVLPSPTPTFAAMGTAHPTLTPTITPTSPPLPHDPASSMTQVDEVEDICPTETLFTIDAPPQTYDAIGRIIGPASGEYLWAVEPEDGNRYPDETIPACGIIVNCKFSPDGVWILVTGSTQIFVVHPDGTDSRILFDEEDRWPSDIWWSGIDTIEYEVYGQVPNQPEGYFNWMYQRDILGVFPDPQPWLPEVILNNQYANNISRQPGGGLVLVSTNFTTGIDLQSQYYLYDSETGDYQYIQRGYMDARWDSFGRRLFYASSQDPYRVNMLDITTNEQSRVSGNGLQAYGGTWSPEGRYIAYRTDRRAQPIAIWDSQTGLTRTYCIPETGARLYDGTFTWSPDSRYIALQAFLPRDETQLGVGQHVLILNVETGDMLDLTTGFNQLLVWSNDPAGEGE